MLTRPLTDEERRYVRSIRNAKKRAYAEAACLDEEAPRPDGLSPMAAQAVLWRVMAIHGNAWARSIVEDDYR